jgi:beta-xylosidase
VDKVYDALLALGLKPFVELNPMPAALASGTQTMFHYRMNVTPPRDWNAWHNLVRAFTAHCVERYGPNEVLHVEFRPQGPVAAPKSDELSLQESAAFEAQLGGKSRD